MKYEIPRLARGKGILPRVTVNFAPQSAQSSVEERIQKLKEDFGILDAFGRGAHFISKREACLVLKPVRVH